MFVSPRYYRISLRETSSLVLIAHSLAAFMSGIEVPSLSCPQPVVLGTLQNMHPKSAAKHSYFFSSLMHHAVERQPGRSCPPSLWVGKRRIMVAPWGSEPFLAFSVGFFSRLLAPFYDRHGALWRQWRREGVTAYRWGCEEVGRSGPLFRSLSSSYSYKLHLCRIPSQALINERCRRNLLWPIHLCCDFYRGFIEALSAIDNMVSSHARLHRAHAGTTQRTVGENSPYSLDQLFGIMQRTIEGVANQVCNGRW